MGHIFGSGSSGLGGWEWKGLNANKLKEYFLIKHVRLYINAGSWKAFAELKKGIMYIIARKKETLTISDIPTEQLSQISALEAKVVVDNIKG